MMSFESSTTKQTEVLFCEKNIRFLVVDHNLLPTFFMTTSFTSFSPLDYCSLPLMVPLAIFACENKSFGSRKRKIRFSTHI